MLRKSAVPMEPPIATSWTFRFERLRCSPFWSSAEAVDESSFVSFWASETLLDLSTDIRFKLPAAEDDDSWRTAMFAGVLRMESKGERRNKEPGSCREKVAKEC